MSNTGNNSPLQPVYGEWEDVSDSHDKETGGERHIYSLSETLWISALHRLTGFGYWEWETAIVRIREDGDPKKYARGKWDDREVLIVRGDRRAELTGKTEQEVMKWYEEHIRQFPATAWRHC